MLTVKVEGSREHAFQLGQEVHMLMVFLIVGRHLLSSSCRRRRRCFFLF